MQPSERVLSRGAMAGATGVHSETIRYYERIGLMPKPDRSGGGHRVYRQSDLERLHFIKRCRELGFRLDEVRALLRLVDGGNYTCGEIREHAAAHLKDIEAKLRDLHRMQHTLERMIASCDDGAVSDCPIVAALLSTKALNQGRRRRSDKR